MVVVILEDIERQRELLHVQQGKCLTESQVFRFLDLMNWAQYHLQKLQTDIHKPS
jgi:hypothetical protein